MGFGNLTGGGEPIGCGDPKGCGDPMGSGEPMGYSDPMGCGWALAIPCAANHWLAAMACGAPLGCCHPMAVRDFLRRGQAERRRDEAADWWCRRSTGLLVVPEGGRSAPSAAAPARAPRAASPTPPLGVSRARSPRRRPCRRRRWRCGRPGAPRASQRRRPRARALGTGGVACVVASCRSWRASRSRPSSWLRAVGALSELAARHDQQQVGRNHVGIATAWARTWLTCATKLGPISTVSVLNWASLAQTRPNLGDLGQLPPRSARIRPTSTKFAPKSTTFEAAPRQGPLFSDFCRTRPDFFVWGDFDRCTAPYWATRGCGFLEIAGALSPAQKISGAIRTIAGWSVSEAS